MAERKLNFNAPLMSVRRIASRPVSPIRTPPPLPTEQVTEPVAVPFHWEQIPGLAKGINKVEPKKKLAPRTPPGKKKHRREEEDEAEDAYSDALDTMCSHSQESGSDGGGFSTDPHTRDFMMNRFLPAAKAMAFTYTPKKQSPKPAPKQVIHTRLSLPPNGVSSSPKIHQQQPESESDEEDHNGPQVITERGCGLFPRLCFRNYLSLLGPLPSVKLSSPKPNKSAYNQSISKSVKKAWDTHMKRLESGSFSPQRREGREEKKTKKGDESKRFAFSGEIMGRLSPFRTSRAADVRSRSGELHMFDNKGRAVESKRFAYSGELNRGRLSPLRNTRPAENPKPDLGSRSAELKMAENMRASYPRRLANSGDLQRVSLSSPSSPFRPTSRAASISPYRNQFPQSPFRRGAFLGLPKEENAKAGNKFQQVSGSRRSFSPIPAIEKTLYVDSAERGSGYLGSKPRFHSGEQLRGARWAEEEFSFQDLKSLNNAMALEILEQEMCVPRKSKHGQEVKCSETLNAKADTDYSLSSSSAKSPLHPPLPRSPSESWLWRTISLQNSFGLKVEANDSEPKISSTSTTKWETIVKTSKSHHDHARYSEVNFTIF